MPSARDLLHQADALMRSNRSVGTAEADASVPVLTDIAVPGAAGSSSRHHRDEIPVLTDAVAYMQDADFSVPSQRSPDAQFSEAVAMPDDSTILPLSQMPQTTVRERAPIGSQTEPVFSVTAMQAQLAEAEDWDAGLIAQAPSGPQPAPVAEAPGAAEIAETVYYQVLQNLDLYTERALQEHLTRHLSPILERASQELLATLHANLGALIRQYVADAIEKQLGVRPDSSE